MSVIFYSCSSIVTASEPQNNNTPAGQDYSFLPGKSKSVCIAPKRKELSSITTDLLGYMPPTPEA